MLTRAQALQTLGLKDPASERDIRAAYRALAQRFHPDRAGESGRFTEITAAYNALLQGDIKPPTPGPSRVKAPSAPNQRADVEAWRAWRRRAEQIHKQGRPEAPASPPPEPEAPPASPPSSPKVKVAERIARKPGLLERIKARLRRVGAARLDGRDESLRLPVSGAVILKGAHQRIAIERMAPCPACDGEPDCDVCEARRRVKVREEIKVYIPPGARSGAKLRLEGKGTAGLEGRPDGDLYLLLEPEPIEGFERREADLYGRIEVPRAVARGGGEITAPGPDGEIQLGVPKGTRPGDLLKLSGEGLPEWGGGSVGDLFFEVDKLI